MKPKSFREDIEYRIYCLKHFIKKYGWRIITETKTSIELERFIFYEKQATNVSLKITYDPIEVETILNHPFKGETKLLRIGDLSVRDVENIFRNPRTHMPDKIKSQYISD